MMEMGFIFCWRKKVGVDHLPFFITIICTIISHFFFWVFRRVVSNVCHQFLTSKFQVQTQPEQLRQGGGI